MSLRRPAILRRYPHLLPEDSELWSDWLRLHAIDVLSVEYDVRVGAGRDPGNTYEPQIRKMGLDLSMRRIDCVCQLADSILIIEVCHLLTLTSIGQYYAYQVLYKRTFNPTRPTHAILVSREIHGDLQPVLEELRISYEIVPKTG